jgi:hypothetical protein
VKIIPVAGDLAKKPNERFTLLDRKWSSVGLTALQWFFELESPFESLKGGIEALDKLE